ncbi:DNA-directed RNA polymerase specialized sigma subunit [Paenibacillus harenae]|nr:DNA-directed RNA polymerase specialized sigma subunit [Paenibacillus harenae]
MKTLIFVVADVLPEQEVVARVIGTIGLIKAIESFQTGKGTKLATFAARCIENEIFMHLRSLKKTRKDVSLHDPIGTDKEGNEITLIDIPATEADDVGG